MGFGVKQPHLGPGKATHELFFPGCSLFKHKMGTTVTTSKCLGGDSSIGKLPWETHPTYKACRAGNKDLGKGVKLLFMRQGERFPKEKAEKYEGKREGESQGDSQRVWQTEYNFLTTSSNSAPPSLMSVEKLLIKHLCRLGVWAWDKAAFYIWPFHHSLGPGETESSRILRNPKDKLRASRGYRGPSWHQCCIIIVAVIKECGKLEWQIRNNLFG